jgi:hypothetical protein
VAPESRLTAGAEGVTDDLKDRIKEAARAISGNQPPKQEETPQDKNAAHGDVTANEADPKEA